MLFKGGDLIWVLAIGKASYDAKLDLSMVARAFGASNITFVSGKSGDNKKLMKYCEAMDKKWGGKFGVSFADNWKEFISEKKNYLKVYLTRYGTPMKRHEYQINTYKNVLAIVSFTETIKQLYKSADFNISITTQPHTCTSSVAIFLHNFYKGRELAMHFENAAYKIEPEEHGVNVKRLR